jgi:aspartyl aminopeptidase
VTAPADLLAFLHAATSPYHAVAEAAARLEANGFTEITETAALDEVGAAGRRYVRRGGALLAWVEPDQAPAAHPFRLIGAHTDSPGLRLKPHPDTGSAGWRQLAVELYGGLLLNSWLDRDLGLSGRVVLRSGEVRLLQVHEAVARVPQLAIHLDRDVNDGLRLDKQSHLTPVWGLGAVDDGGFRAWLGDRLECPAHELLAWDLAFHDLTPPAHLGRDDELLAAGRLDNLLSCWCALDALVAATESGPPAATPVVALFDHEEVGSDTATGASGPLLEHLLRRVVHARPGGGADALARALAASSCVSADMAHAVHPNYPERHEPGHRPLPNGGPVLKVNVNQRYATDAVTAAGFVTACERAGVPHQVFVSRNSMPCGSTIGPVTATRLGIPTVDVGCAQLSMHSARELMGADDAAMFVAALTETLRA